MTDLTILPRKDIKDMSSTKQPLVSIVVPMHNAARFIHDTIQTAQAQTYKNWEMLIVDDASTDDSVAIVKNYVEADSRIRLLSQTTNGGAAKARNAGVAASKGRYIAFLDADDLWHPDKLRLQLDFAKSNDYAFTFTDYEFADERGKPNGKIANIPASISYDEALKKTYISTITVMLDSNQIDKHDMMMKDYTIGEDTVAWWHILSKYGEAYGLQKVRSYYRRSATSESANKLKAIKFRWKLYRESQGFGILKSIYYFFFYIHNAISRRM